MKIHNIKQRSDEWFAIRNLKMTASHSTAIMASGKGLFTYCNNLVMEHYCNNLEIYTNRDMERGVELEPIARDAYIIETLNSVREVGFVEYSKYFGASPDGKVNSDGNLEIKCMNNLNHFKFILDNKIKSDWVNQMQGQMLANDGLWCDFVAFNPNFDKAIIIVRVARDEKKIDKLRLGIKEGEGIIKDLRKQYDTQI